MSFYTNINTRLFKPFPYTRGFYTEMTASLRLCIILAFLFYWVEPFGIQCASKTHLLFFVVVAFLSALINWSVAHFLVIRFVNTEHWTVFKDIIRSLIFLLVNGLFLLWYANFIGNPFDVGLAFKFIFYTFLVAIIPLYYRNLSIHNSLLRKRLDEAEQLNTLIDKKSTQSPKNSSIIIRSNIVNESIETNSDELLFIRAEKNYINIFLLRNETIEHVLLRISLVKTLRQLNDEFIIQCHRSYIVNLRHVSKVSGNSQGLRLILDEKTKIPVSKTYKEIISKKILDLKSL